MNVRFDMSLCRRLCVQRAGDHAGTQLLLGVLLTCFGLAGINRLEYKRVSFECSYQ